MGVHCVAMTPSSSEALVAGRFEVGARVGHGGMGTVFRGVDTQTGEAVAIKFLNAEGEPGRALDLGALRDELHRNETHHTDGPGSP